MQHKRSTVQDYRIILTRHFVPFFGTRTIDRVSSDEVTAPWLPSSVPAT